MSYWDLEVTGPQEQADFSCKFMVRIEVLMNDERIETITDCRKYASVKGFYYVGLVPVNAW